MAETFRLRIYNKLPWFGKLSSWRVWAVHHPNDTHYLGKDNCLRSRLVITTWNFGKQRMSQQTSGRFSVHITAPWLRESCDKGHWSSRTSAGRWRDSSATGSGQSFPKLLEISQLPGALCFFLSSEECHKKKSNTVVLLPNRLDLTNYCNNL